MLTASANGANSTPRAVMMTIGEISRRDGVSKPTVSIHVKRLVERSNLTVERDAQGRVARVNVVEYDYLRGVTADPSKAQAPALEAPTSHRNIDPRETYDEALRQKTWHEAERRRMDLDVMKGRLIRRDKLAEAVMACGEDIVRVLERIPSWSDELATAVAREGTHGLTVALKARTGLIRNEIADALSDLAASSPEVDGDVEPTS